MADGEYVVFDREDGKRITNAVRQVETWRRGGTDLRLQQNAPLDVCLYAKLTEKDPDGQTGYWKAEEVRIVDGQWEVVEGGRLWDDGEFAYCQSYDRDDAEIGSIVKMFSIVNTSTGLKDWVFSTDITNPEGLVFYADDNGGTGQALNTSTWTTKTGAKVLTNVGTFDILPGFTINSGQSAQVTIQFVDNGDGYVLNSAVMATGEGQYWAEADGVITVNVRIAKTEVVGDYARLKQWHSGDIYIEVYGYGRDDSEDGEPPYDYTEPFEVVGDNKWIHVTRAGNVFTVWHRVPDPAEAKGDFKALANTFNCNAVTWTTLQDAEDWANTLLAAIKEVYWDKKGHIYKVQDCGGGNAETTDNTDLELLTATLTSALVGADIRPEAVGGDGVDMTYKVFNNGGAFTDFTGVRSCMLVMKNDLGEVVNFDLVGGAPAAMSGFDSEVMATITANSGRTESHIYLSPFRFRFNASIDTIASTVGVGLKKTVTNTTATCTATHNTSSLSIRDLFDINNTPFEASVDYSIANLDGAYHTWLNFTDSNGNDIKWSIGLNSTPAYGGQYLDLDAVSGTGTLIILFDFDDYATITQGSVINMCSELKTLAENYDANASKCTELFVSGSSTPVTITSQFTGTSTGAGAYSGSFTTARTNIEADTFKSSSTSANTAGYQPYDGTTLFDLYRGWVAIDVTSLSLIQININEFSRKTLGTNASYSVRYTQSAPGSTVSGIDSWTAIGTGTITGSDSATGVTTTNTLFLDVSSLTGTLYIGNIFDADKDNTAITFANPLNTLTAFTFNISSITGS